MAEPIHDKMKRSLQAAEGLYHRLVLLVGETGSGKTGVLRDIAEEFGSSVVNVNLALSCELLELTVKQRSLRLPGIFDQIADQAQPLVVLGNLEILFDKDLKQDPLRLLQGISRNRVVWASCNGTMNSGRLLYAETGHPEYRSYDCRRALQFPPLAGTSKPAVVRAKIGQDCSFRFDCAILYRGCAPGAGFVASVSVSVIRLRAEDM